MPVKDILKNNKYIASVCVSISREDSREIVQDLMDTAHYHKKDCAGLAANQLGYDKRVFVIKIKGRFVAFINPEFSPMGATIKSTERCLSFLDKQIIVKRASIIKASPARGKKKHLILAGMEAVAFQHMLDHLNGLTI